MIVKRPGFAAFVIIALGLALGVNTAVFSTIEVLLMCPLPVERPDCLAAVILGSRDQARGNGLLSYPEYLAIRGDDQVFGLDAGPVYVLSTVQRNDGERPLFVNGEIVSGNYFDLLGVQARLGRAFTAAEADAPNAEAMVVISHALWSRRFNADPTIIGRKVFLNMAAFTVIGLDAPAFQGTYSLPGWDYWYPLGVRSRFYQGYDDYMAAWATNREQRELRVLGRLRPGVTRAQAAPREWRCSGRPCSTQFPATNAGTRLAGGLRGGGPVRPLRGHA